MKSIYHPGTLFFFFITAIAYVAVVKLIPYPFHSLIKPLPILMLILGVMQSSISHAAKSTLAIILLFSGAGDIVLTFRGEEMLKFGIVCFLLAHLGYIVAFKSLWQFQRKNVYFFIPIVFALLGVLWFLLPHLGELQLPVLIYMVVISTMAYTAFQVNKDRGYIVTGALIFLCSDSILAINLFVYPELDLRMATMTTYYLSQLLLISGLIHANTPKVYR